MFGIDQISWGQFARFLMSSIVVWYLSFVLLAYIRGKSNKRNTLFEDERSGPVFSEGLKSISVSSHDFPSELIPFHFVEDMPLPVSFYEETGIDEGISLNRFQDPDNPLPAELLDQIQFQQ